MYEDEIEKPSLSSERTAHGEPYEGSPVSSGKAIGLDMGLTHFCITSDGSKFENPRWIDKHEQNLKRKQQQLSRKLKGSNNRNKARKKVARVHLKIANCRSDSQHKLSRRIVDENQIICVENLAVANMMKNHNLAKSIQQVGWGQFLTMLKIYQEIDRFYPSSKIHNSCLFQIKSLPLEVRFWDCPNCKTKHIDRDVNAACNIRDEALRILNLTSGTGDKAYCPDVRRSNRGRKKSTVARSVG